MSWIARVWGGAVLGAMFVLGATGCETFGKKGPRMEVLNVTRTYDSPTTGKPREYWMYVPKDYNDSARKFPLILFLHGMGESGDDINVVLKHGPIKVAMFLNQFPFLVVSPQCPKPQPGAATKGWPMMEADVMKILDEVKRDYRVDESRIYLTGLSMGGFGSFYFAEKFPGMFAAVAPICGGGDPSKVQAYVGTPFWVFHGAKDKTVPPNRSVEMVEAMKAAGVDVQFTLYPDAAHDSWTETYESDEFYAWLLKHKLPAKGENKNE